MYETCDFFSSSWLYCDGTSKRGNGKREWGWHAAISNRVDSNHGPMWWGHIDPQSTKSASGALVRYWLCECVSNWQRESECCCSSSSSSSIGKIKTVAVEIVVIAVSKVKLVLIASGRIWTGKLW